MNNENINLNESPKKNNLGLIIGIAVAVVLIALGIILIPKMINNESSSKIKEETKVKTKEEEKSSNTKKVDYTEYTENYPKEKRTIDYYYNIFTPAFDKTKYNKEISFFGKIIEGPLTIKKLKDNNIIFNNNGYTFEYRYDGQTIKTYKGINIYIDGEKYPDDNSPSVYLIDTDNNDNDEIYYDNSTIYKNTKNVIVPYIKNVDIDNLTLDDIINSLGVPTYVGERISKLEKVEKTFGLTYFSYIYDYNDDIFKFEITYSEKGGIDITNMIYMGKEYYYNRKVSSYNSNSNDYTHYNNLKEFYEHQYELYQEDLTK